MIKTVIRLANDMVMALDEAGEQIPEFQGHYEDVKRSILMNAPEGAIFNHWFGLALEPETVSRERW